MLSGSLSSLQRLSSSLGFTKTKQKQLYYCVPNNAIIAGVLFLQLYLESNLSSFFFCTHGSTLSCTPQHNSITGERIRCPHPHHSSLLHAFKSILLSFLKNLFVSNSTKSLIFLKPSFYQIENYNTLYFGNLKNMRTLPQ